MVKENYYIECWMESCWCANVHEQHEKVQLPNFWRKYNITLLFLKFRNFFRFSLKTYLCIIWTFLWEMEIIFWSEPNKEQNKIAYTVYLRLLPTIALVLKKENLPNRICSKAYEIKKCDVSNIQFHFRIAS